jgi:anti-sigma B factor antagonist
MSTPVTLEVSEADGWTIIAVTGEIDISSAPALREAIDQALGDGSDRLIVDMNGVSFMDSSGLNVLAGAAKRMSRGSLRIAAPARHIRKVFEITGTDQVIPTFDSQQDAMVAPPPARRPTP